MKWSYGVTTVPSRRELLHQTLASLTRAGFGGPRLFVDGTRDVEGYEREFNCEVTIRSGNLHWKRDSRLGGPAGNWVLSILELFIRDPGAELFALFQDDVLSVTNLRAYLEHIPYPDKGYWNLYTWGSNIKHIEEQNPTYNQPGGAPVPPMPGFYLSNQWGKGAVGLVFSRETLMKLFDGRYLIDRFNDPHRGHKAIDGGIITALAKHDIKEYVHYPSLLQHTGQVSTFRTTPYDHAVAHTFPGEDFDALTWLPTEPKRIVLGNPTTDSSKFRTLPHERRGIISSQRKPPEPAGLGDAIAAALDKVGITKERVEQWVGRPCGCAERQAKLNQLGFWAKRVFLGKTEQAKEHLEEMIKE